MMIVADCLWLMMADEDNDDDYDDVSDESE